MIKLIATDVDGTLCRISTPKIHEGYYAAARTLLDKGVKFVALPSRNAVVLPTQDCPLST